MVPFTACMKCIVRIREEAEECAGDVSRYSKVGLLRKLLAETSRERAEWILWIDADTLIQACSAACLASLLAV